MKRIVLTLLAAIAGGLLAAGRPVGARLERAAGQEHALELDVRLPDGVDVAAVAPIWRGRLSAYEVDIAPRGAIVHVTVRGALAKDAAAVIGALTEPGNLAMYEVASDTPAMEAIYRAARVGSLGDDVTVDIDSWSHEDTNKHFTDYYLLAHTRAALEAAIAALPSTVPEATLDVGDRFAIEQVTPVHSAADQRAYWRSYVLRGAAILDQRNVADATVMWDPQTNRPLVLLDFDEDGRDRFADASERLVGHKIAIVKDGAVMSAPVIQTRIPGGRANITMGAGDSNEQQHEAEALAGALRGGGPPLPPGIVADLVSVREPSSAIIWGLRGAATLIAALAGWLLVTGVARTSTAVPGVPRTRRGGAGGLAIAIAVTVAVPVALWLAERVAMPGLDSMTARDLVDNFHAHLPSIVSLGVWPAVTGLVAAEALAMLIPSWRASGRLQPAAAIFTLVFAILMGRGSVSVIERASALPESVVRHAWLATASLVAGAMLFIVGANLITRRGLCNGWVVLIGVTCARDLAASLDPTHAGVATIGALLAIVAVETRSAGRRQPSTSLAPLLLVAACVGLVTALVRAVPGTFDPLLRLHWRSTVLQYLVPIAGLGALLALARVRSIASIATSVAIVLLMTWLDHWALVGAVLGVAAVELGAGLLRRIRMGDAAPLLAVRDVDRADAAVDALLAAGIPATTEGSRMRALLRGFAPWSPVVVYVPADQVDRARSIATPHLVPRLAEAAQVFE